MARSDRSELSPATWDLIRSDNPSLGSAFSVKVSSVERRSSRLEGSGIKKGKSGAEAGGIEEYPEEMEEGDSA